MVIFTNNFQIYMFYCNQNIISKKNILFCFINFLFKNKDECSIPFKIRINVYIISYIGFWFLIFWTSGWILWWIIIIYFFYRYWRSRFYFINPVLIMILYDFEIIHFSLWLFLGRLWKFRLRSITLLLRKAFWINLF